MQRVNRILVFIGILLVASAIQAQPPYAEPAAGQSVARCSALPDLARDVTLSGIDADAAWQRLQQAAMTVPQFAQLRKQFQARPDYQQALNQRQQAQAKYEQLRDGVLARLYDDESYKSALLDRDLIQAHLRKAQDLGPADDVVPTAQAKLRCVLLIHQMEQSALDGDPSIRAALADLDQASARLRALDDIFNKTWSSDPTYAEASRNVSAAQEAYDQTARTYAGASAAYQEAMTDREVRFAQSVYLARQSYWNWPRYSYWPVYVGWSPSVLSAPLLARSHSPRFSPTARPVLARR